MKLSEDQKARLRAVQAPARAEGRELTLEEERELTDAVFACIGEDITDRVTYKKKEDGETVVYLDGERHGVIESK